MGQIDWAQRLAEGRQRGNAPEGGSRVHHRAGMGEPGSIAAHHDLFERALVPQRDAAGNSQSSPYDEEVFGPQAPAPRQVARRPNRRELEMPVTAVEVR